MTDLEPRPPAALHPPPAPTATAGAPRIVALDVVRGVALCGILLVNAGPVTHFQFAITHDAATLDDPSGWLQLLVQQRFFPVFSLLFGTSAALFLASAARRTAHPRRVLLRRLLVLAPLGVLHQVFHPGEALAVYAVVGVVVLLPSTRLPRWAVAVAAVVLVAASLVLTGGGLTLVPGMFLVGSALVRWGVVTRAVASTRGPLLLLLVLAPAAALALRAQLRDLPASSFSTSSAVAGLLLAGVYVCALLVLLRTPLRRPLVAVFAPLGTMALTLYVGATAVLVVGRPLLDLPHERSWTPLAVLVAGILLAQWCFAVLWLGRFRQGPLEHLWRWATWGSRPPLRRAPLRAG